MPTHAQRALPILAEPAQRTWRNKLYDDITGPSLQAIVAFGGAAQKAVDLWDTKLDVPIFKVPHPSQTTTRTARRFDQIAPRRSPVRARLAPFA